MLESPPPVPDSLSFFSWVCGQFTYVSVSVSVRVVFLAPAFRGGSLYLGAPKMRDFCALTWFVWPPRSHAHHGSDFGHNCAGNILPRIRVQVNSQYDMISCVCMHMRICIYIDIHIYTPYILVCICIYVYIYIYTYICTPYIFFEN
jgi:hypothetical protein